MKQFAEFIKTKAFTVFAVLLFAVLLIVSFYLYQLPLKAVIYPLAICLFLGIVFIVIKYIKTAKNYEKIKRAASLDAEMIENLPKPETLCEKGYLALVKSLQKEVIKEKEEAAAKYGDMVDYYTVWAHQIKTPISSMKLTLQNEDSETSRRLLSDLFRTQQYVDMVLAFLRMGSSSNDYLFREYSLDTILRQSIKKFASEFILRKLSVNYETADIKFVTDEKWFAFLIEQLLSNALKYTESGEISIYMKDSDTLCIADTGIGIAPEDLPRIFEKGYTGNNGRTDKTASGLGLYLCRRISENLHLSVFAESELCKGTKMYIKLNQNNNLTNM